MDIWKDMTELFQKQVNILKKTFGEVMREINNRPLRAQYMATWHDGNFDVNITWSESLCRHHHIRGFIHRPLVVKIKPNTGQTLGTTDKREIRRNMIKSEGRAFLTIETSKTFYCFLESPWCRIKPTHYVLNFREAGNYSYWFASVLN